MNRFSRWYKSFGRPMIVGGGIGVVCAILYGVGAFHTLSAQMTDRLFTKRSADARIVLIAIDHASIAQVGRWPWDRSVHAKLIGELTRAGASVIAYDVNFSERQNGTADAELASAIQTSGRVVLPTELQIMEVEGRLVADPRRTITPYELFLTSAMRTGYSNTPPDGDGVVRTIPIRVFSGGERKELFPFAFEAAQAYDETISLSSAPVDRLGRLIVSYPGSPGRNYLTISAIDILEHRYQDTDLKGKLVFVGSTASDLHDERFVPTSLGVPMPGVEIHAALADTFLQRRWIAEPVGWMMALGLILIGIINGWIVSRFRIWLGFLFTALLFGAAMVFSAVSFEYGIIIDVLWTALASSATFVGVVIERRLLSEQERQHLKRLFQHYVSPSVAELVMRDSSKLKLGGERKRMTVMFSDIRVFSALTETTPPEQLLEKLNVYFAAMTSGVFKYQGVLDKFMGDGMMAFWNAPFDQKDHALRAVKTALDMQRTLDKLNREGVFGNPPWFMGIGINTGEMIVGNIGGENHADYTVIGDAVNLASRVEGLTREYQVPIIVTDATAKELEGKMLLRRLDRVTVKGRYQALTIYEVVCELSRATLEQKELVEGYERALDLYAKRDFDEVIYQCRQIVMKYPKDHPTLLLNDRARSFLNTPPPKGWDGTWVYTEK